MSNLVHRPGHSLAATFVHSFNSHALVTTRTTHANSTVMFLSQMVTHLLRCHLMMEPIAVSTWRQLPSLHPVRKLLFPHIKGVLAINTLGRPKIDLARWGGRSSFGHRWWRTRHVDAKALQTYHVG